MKLLFAALACMITGMQCSPEQPRHPGPQVQKAVSPIRTPVFDKERAFRSLTSQTDFGPRVPGTAAHEKCLAFLRRELQAEADTVRVQPFTHVGYEGTPLAMTNVIASFNPSSSDRILLIAHWDSRGRADEDPDPAKQGLPVPGANDGASGVAVLLEIARAFKAQPPPVGVDMLFTDGEDFGKESDFDNYFLGARHFAKHLPPGYAPAFGILLDMVGDKDLEIMKEPYSVEYAPDVVELVWAAARDAGVYQFTENTQRHVLDDHIPLNEAGIKTIDLIDFEYPYWHTTADTPDKCSPESLEAVGNVLLHLLYQQRP